MQELSEDHWCAGWVTGLEYSLWNFVTKGPGKWGFGSIDEQKVARLSRLSQTAGGWWRWDAACHGPVFVPLEAWREEEVATSNWSKYVPKGLDKGDLVVPNVSNKQVRLWLRPPARHYYDHPLVEPHSPLISNGDPYWVKDMPAVIIDFEADWVQVLLNTGEMGWIGSWNVRKVNE